MLSLREQIHRDPVGEVRHRRGAVTYHQNFRRPRHHINTDRAIHAALGRGDVGIAGADDLVDLRHRLRAIRKRTDRLRAADGERAVDTGKRGRRQHQRGLFASWHRYHHHDFLNAGDLCRQCVHQRRRWVCRFAARNIDPDTVERSHLLAKQRAVLVNIVPRLRQLLLMIRTHARCRLLERVALRCWQRRQSALHLSARELEFRD